MQSFTHFICSSNSANDCNFVTPTKKQRVSLFNLVKPEVICPHFTYSSHSINMFSRLRCRNLPQKNKYLLWTRKKMMQAKAQFFSPHFGRQTIFLSIILNQQFIRNAQPLLINYLVL